MKKDEKVEKAENGKNDVEKNDLYGDFPAPDLSTWERDLVAIFGKKDD